MEWYVIVMGIIVGSLLLALVFLIGFVCGSRARTNSLMEMKELQKELDDYIDAYQRQGIKYRRIINDVYTDEAIQKLENAIQLIKEAQNLRDEEKTNDGQMGTTDSTIEGTDGSRMEQ